MTTFGFIFDIKPRTEADYAIALNKFIKGDRDITGWYSRGHQNVKKFLTLVAQKEPHVELSPTGVRWSWAKVDKHHLEEVSSSTSGATPITLIEVHGVNE